MTGPELFLVFARAQNGVIGQNGRLPWHIPADLAHFKRLTMGTPMIMGRATYDSLPGVLPGRRHIVLTRDEDWSGEDAEIAHDFDSAIHLANAARIAVIGGADVFAQAMPLARRIEMTEVHRDFEGDVTMPAPPAGEWEETGRSDCPEDGNRPAYSFVTLRRRA
ncbi:dihydrofolate reductase [Croceicoccus marinus]|uniref:Dihydrofolate reductase n=1 Tax=Croceicoccus marinus TaxID=450378 RepID=A0A7G6VUV8_9SPHN|nr:dihydrofolate reductase [Croceicoccus marinus]QNE05523.1 dihydrofolate reductase [Croceicoccus marinus]